MGYRTVLLFCEMVCRILCKALVISQVVQMEAVCRLTVLADTTHCKLRLVEVVNCCFKTNLYDLFKPVLRVPVH